MRAAARSHHQRASAPSWWPARRRRRSPDDIARSDGRAASASPPVSNPGSQVVPTDRRHRARGRSHHHRRSAAADRPARRRQQAVDDRRLDHCVGRQAVRRRVVQHAGAPRVAGRGRCRAEPIRRLPATTCSTSGLAAKWDAAYVFLGSNYLGDQAGLPASSWRRSCSGCRRYRSCC